MSIQTIPSLGGPTLATADEHQVPDAHHDSHQGLHIALSWLGCPFTVFLGWGTSFCLRSAKCLETHGVVVKADSVHCCVGLVLSRLVLAMQVCSVKWSPMVALGAPVLLDSIDGTDFTFTLIGFWLTAKLLRIVVVLPFDLGIATTNFLFWLGAVFSKVTCLSTVKAGTLLIASVKALHERVARAFQWSV